MADNRQDHNRPVAVAAADRRPDRSPLVGVVAVGAAEEEVDSRLDRNQPVAGNRVWDRRRISRPLGRPFAEIKIVFRELNSTQLLLLFLIVCSAGIKLQ